MPIEGAVSQYKTQLGILLVEKSIIIMPGEVEEFLVADQIWTSLVLP